MLTCNWALSFKLCIYDSKIKLIALPTNCTFSLWKDTPSMLEYAHRGAHQQAIEAAYKHNYFSESLFVRMRLLEHMGQWPAPQSPPHDNGGSDSNVYHLPGGHR